MGQSRSNCGFRNEKKRPALIISNDMGNENSHIVIVALITSKAFKHVYPFEVEVVVRGKSGKIMLNQCRTIDKSRLDGKIDSIDHETMKAVEDALKIVFSLT